MYVLQEGWTPLDHSALYGHVHTTRLLVDKLMEENRKVDRAAACC